MIHIDNVYLVVILLYFAHVLHIVRWTIKDYFTTCNNEILAKY